MFYDRKSRRSFIFDNDWGFTRGTQMRGPYIYYPWFLDS